MKKYIAILLVFALITTSVFSQATLRIKAGTITVPPIVTNNGQFSFNLSSVLRTSAGVFKNDSILVKTLWSDSTIAAGTCTAYWDGTDDYGNVISSPDATYKVKVLSNDIQYTWQGTIGNSSDSATGLSKHKGYNNSMKGLVFNVSYGYYCTGYSEKTPSFAKFNVATPNQKIPMTVATSESTSDVDYVCTDGTKVYWGAFDANSSNNSYVFATNISDDSYASFSSGVSYTPLYRPAINVIGYQNIANGLITGLATQQSGSNLFIARAGLNQLQVLNKTTGALVSTLTFTAPTGLCVDGSDNLWMIQNNQVSKYSVSGGALTLILTLSGTVSPQSVNYVNGLITVCDAGGSQQVKFYNTSGAIQSTLGTAGGYATNATVSDTKFYFKDTLGNKPCFVAGQSDGSYWVNDFGNSRTQHFNSSNTFVNRIMFMGSSYSVYADPNNANRVWAGYLEFDVGYPSLTWTLVKNWGNNVTSTYDGFGKIHFQITLSNGRTYGLIRNGYNYEVVEFVSGGTLRFTGVMRALDEKIAKDGAILKADFSGSTFTYKRFALTGFDGSNNPTWSSTAEVLGSATENTTVGNPASYTFDYSSTLQKLALFHPATYSNNSGPIFSSGYHLGAIAKGSTNSYLWQTEKSTFRNYEGFYPSAGWFEVGNLVNNNGGTEVNFVDSSIITGYHGEFWKNGQTTKFNHYYSNGIALGQFGTTTADVVDPSQAPAMLAGNAITPNVVKGTDGNLYLYVGDESFHSAIHRWEVSGLNTISLQTFSVNFPSAYVAPTVNYTDLMAGLPFNTELPNGANGWTRNPTTNVVVNDYTDKVTAFTSRYQYNPLKPKDILISYVKSVANTSTVSKDLGTNNVTTNWKITGTVTYPGNMPNGNSVSQYLEVLDDAGKVLTTFYDTLNRSTGVAKVLGNGTAIVTSNEAGIRAIQNNSLALTIACVGGNITFTYGSYSPITTAISDGTGNWHKPTTLRVKMQNNGNGTTAYGANIDLQDLKLYKDY
jgi:hypothetical protein